MKTILIALTLLFGFKSNAVETPKPAGGDFIYSGSYVIEGLLRNEVVYTQSQQGQQRLEDLRLKGFECVHKIRQTYLCRKFIQPESDRLDFIDAELAAYYRNWKLWIEDVSELPSLENESPYFVSWISRQAANWNGKIYRDVRYTWANGMYKLWLMNFDGKSDVDFIYSSPSTLEQTHFVRRFSGRVTDEYMVSAVLRSRADD